MPDVLQNLSDELAALTEQVSVSVVRVEARRRLPASGTVWDKGVVVTANHVVERDDDIHIGLPDGNRLSAKLVGRDPLSDIAVLRAEFDLPVPLWTTPETARVGQLVLALGRPSRHIMATLGVISALETGDQLPRGIQVDHFLQTDVVMYPGFSGGALISANGRVLGINTSAMRGISLTIPTSTIRRVVEALLKHGKIQRGYLGVGAQAIKLSPAITAKVGQSYGLLVASVEPDSPAEQGGVLIGDILLRFNEMALSSPEDLLRGLQSDCIGKTVPIVIVRGGELQTLQVTVGERLMR
ncbi:MAG: trypsin-like peptidase domain-containing protein [Anaerolineae bacterium]|nr:trypsin-like peptidase domain-containing protein [Anaerolineae bacterium]